MDFSTMTKEEALEYCYQHEKEFKADAYYAEENGERLFYSLIAILECGAIQPKDLPEYGMNYD